MSIECLFKSQELVSALTLHVIVRWHLSFKLGLPSLTNKREDEGLRPSLLDAYIHHSNEFLSIIQDEAWTLAIPFTECNTPHTTHWTAKPYHYKHGAFQFVRKSLEKADAEKGEILPASNSQRSQTFPTRGEGLPEIVWKSVPEVSDPPITGWKRGAMAIFVHLC